MLSKLKDFTVLYAEDNEGVRKRLVNILNFYFKDVVEAVDGNKAYKIYKTSKPDLVMTDIDMPNMNGVELAKKIRKEDKEIPLIVLTAFSNEEYLLELINLKINHFILKPINSQKLQIALEDIFEHSNILKINEKLSIDLETMDIVTNKTSIKITKRERLFLELLYKNRDIITTYQNIQDLVWQNDIMSQSALKTFIKVLRKKFPTEVIENISGVGYRFFSQ
ncbi:MAG: response regulator transcription factor [Campylobacteraceae bacterium]|nr:response regulator transcription factor [Campylobacteraceae bacterium]